VEAPTAIALEAKIAITPKATNLPTVIETAAISFTSKNTVYVKLLLTASALQSLE
jgi:hypothetical protein